MKLDEKLNTIESLNKRTGKYLTRLGRAMASDWLHLGLVIGIVINLIVLITIVALYWQELVDAIKAKAAA